MNLIVLNSAILIISLHLCDSSLNDAVKRDKRTIDFVIRGFADVFGYDVLKRPSIVVTTPGARKAAPPTFFPPPVAPPKTPLMPTAKPTVPAQPKVTAPPLLTETVRKSFNFNLNWNTNVPQTTAAMPTVKAPLAPQVPVGKNNAVPLTQQNIQYLYDDIEPHRFTILNDNSYNNDYEEPKNVAQILNPTTVDPYSTYQQSKDKFRESITEFWNHSPYYRDEKGYKFLTTPETNDVSILLAPERSKYEEYNLDYKELIKDEQKDENIEEVEEKEIDKYKAAESKENPSLDYQKKTTTAKKVETVIVSKSSCNHKTKKPRSKTKKPKLIEAIKNSAYKNVDNESSDPSEVILPQYSGILPVGLDHLTIGEKNHAPWPIPFDTEASEAKIHEVDPRRRRRIDDSGIAKRSDDYNWNRYVPAVYNPRFDYVAPEQSTENYERYERLEDAEDDEDLKKARVLMRSFGTKINVVKSLPI